MIKINLRDYYTFYHYDLYIEVPDELAAQLQQWERDENAYQRKLYRYKAHYSLDRDDGIEHDILFASLSSSEIYEHNVTYEQIHATISMLPDKQGKRIYAHYFLGISQAAIARTEGVSKMAICSSILRGLKQLECSLKNLLN